jgi:hypothetical protein
LWLAVGVVARLEVHLVILLVVVAVQVVIEHL